MGRRRCLGLAFGALWLTVAGTFFGLLALWMIGTPAVNRVLAAATIVAAASIALHVAMIRVALRLPHAGGPPTAEERLLGRRIFRLGLVEWLAIVAVSVATGVTNHPEAATPLILIVVGLHFIPMAWILNVPRYYTMGVLFCVPPIATMILTAPQSRVGLAPAWFVLPSLGCALVAVVTALPSLHEAWQLAATVSGSTSRAA